MHRLEQNLRFGGHPYPLLPWPLLIWRRHGWRPTGGLRWQRRHESSFVEVLEISKRLAKDGNVVEGSSFDRTQIKVDVVSHGVVPKRKLPSDTPRLVFPDCDRPTNSTLFDYTFTLKTLDILPTSRTKCKF